MNPIPAKALARLALGLAFLLALAGCTNTVPEPENAYTDLPVQTYPFDAVWQCTVEALEATGYPVKDTHRDGETKGSMVTDFKSVKKNALNEQEEAVRIRVRVTQKSEKAYRVEVAPSRYQREFTRDDWSYVGKDDEVLASLRKHLEQSLRDRYR